MAENLGGRFLQESKATKNVRYYTRRARTTCERNSINILISTKRQIQNGDRLATWIGLSSTLTWICPPKIRGKFYITNGSEDWIWSHFLKYFLSKRQTKTAFLEKNYRTILPFTKWRRSKTINAISFQTLCDGLCTISKALKTQKSIIDAPLIL